MASAGDSKWGNRDWTAATRKRKLAAARETMDAIDQKFADQEEENERDPDKRYMRLGRRADVDTAERRNAVFLDDSPDFECLSPTFLCPVACADGDALYPSLEHAFQASKTQDATKRAAIAGVKVREAKKLGAEALRGRDEAFKAHFKKDSVANMEVLLRDKFLRCKELRKALMATEDRLLIHRPPEYKDVYWGEDLQGSGRNELGKALTRLRDSLAAAARAGDGREFWDWVKDRTCAHLRSTRDDTAFKVTFRKSGSTAYSEPETFPATTEIFVGRHEKCSIQLDHASASRAHAAVLRGVGCGCCVVDLGSAHGVFVHKSREAPVRIDAFRVVPLMLGDEVRFGESSKRYKVRLETRLTDHMRGDLYTRLADPATAQTKELDCTLRIQNVAFECQAKDVRALFADMADSLVSCVLPTDGETGAPTDRPPRHRGTAFVVFSTPRDLLQALACDGDELAGRKVRISRANAPPPEKR